MQNSSLFHTLPIHVSSDIVTICSVILQQFFLIQSCTFEQSFQYRTYISKIRKNSKTWDIRHYHQISQKLTEYQPRINSPKIRTQAKTIYQKKRLEIFRDVSVCLHKCVSTLHLAVTQSHWRKPFDTDLPVGADAC